jgi:hypothetical protein
MESSMADKADQTRSGTTLTPASIAEGSPATPIGVLKAQKGKMHQVDLMRDLQFEDPEYLAIEA